MGKHTLIQKSAAVFSLICLLVAGCGEKPETVEAVVARGEALLDNGQIDGAILVLEAQNAQTPGRVDVMEPLAFAYSERGEYTEAALLFSQIAQLSAQPLYFIYAAQSLLAAQDTVGAIGRYAAYLDAKPDDRGVWVQLAELHMQMGNRSEALDAWLRAERIQPRAQHQLAIGQAYLQAENLAQAQVWYARALESEGDERGAALLGLLETAVRSRRFADAYELMGQLDVEHPGLLDSSELSDLRPQLEDWRSRRQAARRAIAQLEAGAPPQRPAPQNAPAQADDAQADDAQADVAAAETAEAEPVAAETDATEPDEAEPEAMEAAGFATAATTVQAQAPVEEAQEQDSKLDTAAAAAAEETVSAQETASAAVVPEATVDEQAVPEATVEEAPLVKARRLVAEGDTAGAIRAYRRHLVADDSAAQVWAELSQLYSARGEGALAQATASEAFRRDASARYAEVWLEVMATHGEPWRVLPEAERLARQFSEDAGVLLRLARAYVAVPGNERNAAIVYRKFLERAGPEHPERAEAEQWLAARGG